MIRNGFLRQTCAITTIAAMAITAAGCASRTGSTQSSAETVTTKNAGTAAPDTVTQALATLPSTSWNDGFVAFGQSARITASDNATANPANGPFSALLPLTDGLVVAPNSQLETQQSALLGFDPQQATYAVTMGAAPQSVTVLYGSFTVSTIETKLTAAGYTRHSATDGDTLWGYGTAPADATTYPQDGDVTVPYVIDVSASRITIGYTASDVEAITTAGGTTLASTNGLGDLATCLGSPTAGMIGTLPQSPRPANPLPAGIGITTLAASSPSVELCVTAPSAASAQAMETRWTTQARTGKDPNSGLPWTKIFTDPQASITAQAQHVVRFTANLTTAEYAAAFLDRYFAGEIAPLIVSTP